jgi:hypothetical protein
VLQKLASNSPIGPDDVVYELGSGRGRACFWLRGRFGCKTVGIECLPLFVQRAKRIASFFHLDKVEFRLEDMTRANFLDATWIYLFGTTLPDQTVADLIKQFERLKPGTKIITISYPLSEVYDSPKIKLLNTLDLEFAWGRTQGYIHEVI